MISIEEGWGSNAQPTTTASTPDMVPVSPSFSSSRGLSTASLL